MIKNGITYLLILSWKNIRVIDEIISTMYTSWTNFKFLKVLNYT